MTNKTQIILHNILSNPDGTPCISRGLKREHRIILLTLHSFVGVFGYIFYPYFFFFFGGGLENINKNIKYCVRTPAECK